MSHIDAIIGGAFIFFRLIGSPVWGCFLYPPKPFPTHKEHNFLTQRSVALLVLGEKDNLGSFLEVDLIIRSVSP